jgi:hypothetical protein
LAEELERKEAAPQENEKTGLAQKLDAIGWGSFLIWLGIVYLVGMDVRVVLLGIGLIILGVQVARLFLKLRVERFWLIVGLLFVVGSLWQLADPRVPIPAILLITAGLALILTQFLRKR